MPDLYNGSLVGITTTTFDTSTAQASFFSLNLTSVGVYVVKFTFASNPADYNFVYEELIPVKAQSHLNMVIDETKDVMVKFNDDYDSIVGTANNKYFAAMMGNTLAVTYPEIILNTISVTKGKGCLISLRYLWNVAFWKFLLREGGGVHFERQMKCVCVNLK
jgi:hypothetical protein